MGAITYQQCLDMGMTGPEAARARGVTIKAAWVWAKRKGVSFRQIPVKDVTERSRYSVFHSMKADERDLYRVYMEARYTRDEALAAIGRADLVAA